MFTRIKKAAVPVAILFAGIGGFAVLDATKPQPDVTVEPPRPLSVYTESAGRASEQLVVNTQGEVRARVRSDVVAQIGGRVIQVSPEFIEGGRFSPGETLLVIEDTDYRSAANEAEARLAAARVDVEQSLADADVARKQLAGVKNPSPLALKRPQVARAQAALKAAEANLSLAKTNLERTRIALPYAGRLATTEVDLGQFVTPGKVLATAFSTERVEIRLPLTDVQLGALGVPIGYVAEDGPGLPVDLAATVAGEQHRWSGWVTRLDAAVDPTTRVVYATAVVHNPYDVDLTSGEMPLAVGLYVDAAVSGRIVDDAVSIPAAGLRAGDRVFILDEDGALDVRKAEVIHRNGERVILAAGVEEGEQVIVSAIRNPIPGMSLEAIGRSAEQVVNETDQVSGAGAALAD